LTFGLGGRKSFSNTDVILKFTILRGGEGMQKENASKQIGAMQIIQ
jgi:hypothetical protein